MKTAPSMAVTSSHALPRSRSLRPNADRASTIVSELMRSTNDETDVNGISNRSVGRTSPLPRVL